MNEINQGWDWFSHLPVLKYLVDTYGIEYAIEHGSGMYSTPLLKNGSTNYQGYEESPEFRDKMIAEGIYSPDDVSLIELPEGVNIATRHCELTFEQKADINKQFDYISAHLSVEFEEIFDYKLLFVDGFTATRNVAINALYDLFDFVVVHDTEPNSFGHYEYDFSALKGAFKQVIVTTPTPHTTMLVREEIFIDFDKLRAYMDDFCAVNNWETDQMDILIKEL